MRISGCDIAVGSYSTGALEALLQHKPAMLFYTKKWGDCLDLRAFDSPYTFFAENPHELVLGIRENISISIDVIKKLQERFFGDPHKNGSKWLVDRLEEAIRYKKEG